jgi:hypothetical protein
MSLLQSVAQRGSYPLGADRSFARDHQAFLEADKCFTEARSSNRGCARCGRSLRTGRIRALRSPNTHKLTALCPPCADILGGPETRASRPMSPIEYRQRLARLKESYARLGVFLR